MSHNDELKFAHVGLRGVQLDSWQAEGSGASLSVWGPCPACLGSASGPVLPLAEAPTAVRGVLPLDGTQPLSTVAIEAECRCGYDHGKPGGDGCGRYWDVPVILSGRKS